MRPVGLVTSTKVWKLPDDCSTSEAMQPNKGHLADLHLRHERDSLSSSSSSSSCNNASSLSDSSWYYKMKKSEHKNKLVAIQMSLKCKKAKVAFGLSTECTGKDSLNLLR